MANVSSERLYARARAAYEIFRLGEQRDVAKTALDRRIFQKIRVGLHERALQEGWLLPTMQSRLVVLIVAWQRAAAMQWALEQLERGTSDSDLSRA